MWIMWLLRIVLFFASAGMAAVVAYAFFQTRHPSSRDDLIGFSVFVALGLNIVYLIFCPPPVSGANHG
jgi:hypothetical protein